MSHGVAILDIETEGRVPELHAVAEQLAEDPLADGVANRMMYIARTGLLAAQQEIHTLRSECTAQMTVIGKLIAHTAHAEILVPRQSRSRIESVYLANVEDSTLPTTSSAFENARALRIGFVAWREHRQLARRVQELGGGEACLRGVRELLAEEIATRLGMEEKLTSLMACCQQLAERWRMAYCQCVACFSVCAGVL